MPLYVTIHGHFYQPPRENPWLEAIEVQETAYPFHDWNERVTAEAYRPNATSRILDSLGRIESIVNNYSRISFNFGPTLLAWLEDEARDVYEAILEADRESLKRFSGHGSAIAQAYNHIIMPLANRRDKTTQVIWGIADFRHRFGRDPEGMWLPETAVDIESLDVLAEQGIKFTILAPRQAGKIRAPGGDWVDMSGERVDTRFPYIAHLPSGRSISLFFYDGRLARAVAFESLLKDGALFAERLLGVGDPNNQALQLSHVATDGETYGHHHRFGDMALAFALKKIEEGTRAKLTNYGEFLELCPPTVEVEIIERTAWSCSHGVERWRSDCGCSTGEHPGWNQAWRYPLRQAFDWLRDTLAPLYEQKGAELLKDPWSARNGYIELILDRSPESLKRFLQNYASKQVTPTEEAQILMQMEMQRHLLLMYTSCGWFFDDLAGIETLQDMQYAGRAVQLAQLLFGDNLEGRFVGMLEVAHSNRPGLPDGRAIYDSQIRPAFVDLQKLCAFYAMSGLLEKQPQVRQIYHYEVERVSGKTLEAGHSKLIFGRANARSSVTSKSDDLFYAALHLGDHNLSCGVKFWENEEVYEESVRDISTAFNRADLTGVIRLLDKYFIGQVYSLRSLFRDGQRQLLNRILADTLREVEALYRELYEVHAPMARFLTDLNVPVPDAFTTAAEFILNCDLKRAIETDMPNVEVIRDTLEEVREWGVKLEKVGLSYSFTAALTRLSAKLEIQANDAALVERFTEFVKLAQESPFDINYWDAQNALLKIAKKRIPDAAQRTQEGDTIARAWLARIHKAAELLKVAV